MFLKTMLHLFTIPTKDVQVANELRIIIIIIINDTVVYLQL